jgi:hypothetical protein
MAGAAGLTGLAREAWQGSCLRREADGHTARQNQPNRGEAPAAPQGVRKSAAITSHRAPSGVVVALSTGGGGRQQTRFACEDSAMIKQ